MADWEKRLRKNIQKDMENSKFSKSFRENVNKNVHESDKYYSSIKGSAKQKPESNESSGKSDSQEEVESDSEEGSFRQKAKYARSGKEGEGGIKRAGQAIGSGAASTGRWGAGKLSNWAQSKSQSAVGITWWIVAIVILLFSGFLGGSWTLGFIFGIGLLLLKYINFKGKSDSKSAWMWKLFFWLIIIIMIMSVIYALAGTGAGKSTMSKFSWYTNSVSASDDLGMSLFTFDLSRNYIWQCLLLNTLGVCDRAEMKGEGGGIFIARLITDLTDYFEAGPKGDLIGIEGTVVGKAWTTATRAKTLDIRSTDVTVSAKWDDEELSNQKWTCEQPIGANSDFYCLAEPLNLGAVKSQDVVVCGTSWISMGGEGEGARVICPARVIEEYKFSTLGFKMYRFSDYPAEVTFNDVTEQQTAWSTGAPVVVTVGQGREWNRAIRPPKEATFRVPIVIENSVPQGFGAITEDLTYNSLSSKLGKLTITMPDRKGIITPICKGATQKQVGTEISCVYDFKDREINGPDKEQYVLELKFDPNMDLSEFVEYSITADLNYTSKMSKLLPVTIKYEVPKKEEEDQGGMEQQT